MACFTLVHSFVPFLILGIGAGALGAALTLLVASYQRAGLLASNAASG